MTVDQLGRAYNAYRRTAATRSVAVLLAANAVPLIGVLFFGWSLITILVIYWLENGIVGLWNLPRIALARGTTPIVVPPELPDSAAAAATGSPAAATELKGFWQRARAAQLAAIERASAGLVADRTAPGAPGTDGMSAVARLSGLGGIPLAIFFAFHYGMFWFVHGVFVFALPTFFGAGGYQCVAGEPVFPPGTPGGFPGAGLCASGPFGDVVWSNVVIAGAALFLSHGASFFFNYIGRGEYLTTSPARQMAAPYGRVIALHVTILFGAFAVAFLGTPVAALLILVIVKTALDLGLHRRERRAADARIPVSGS